jgi:hypothetical protein
MSLDSRLQRMKMEGPLHTSSSLHSSFPRTRETRFVPHRISLDIRFRGYDITQIAFADGPGIYFRRSSLVSRH